MLPWWCLTQVVWPWSRTCTKFFLVPWFSICHGVQLSTKWFALYYVQNGWHLTDCVKVHQAADTYPVSDKQKCYLHWNSLLITVFLTQRYPRHKYCASLCARIKGGWQKFIPQWPATVWKVCQQNSKFEEAKVDKVIKENQLSDLRAAPKLSKVKINHFCPGVWKPNASSTW